MFRLNSTLRVLLVICTLAITAAAQSGAGTALGGGGIIGGEKDSLTTTNLSNPSMLSDPAGGSQPHNNVSTGLGLSFIISLLTDGMPLSGF